MAKTADSFKTRGKLAVGGSEFVIYRLDALGERAARLPLSLKVLLENLLRLEDGRTLKRLATARDLFLVLPRAGSAVAKMAEACWYPALTAIATEPSAA